ncbi:hypothetical protein CL644_01815, partial [bacterium]|nr:hypothetical protein [bacterium]
INSCTYNIFFESFLKEKQKSPMLRIKTYCFWLRWVDTFRTLNWNQIKQDLKYSGLNLDVNSFAFK